MTWSEIVTFAFVAGLLVMSPGPNGVLIARTVPTSGRGAGFANVAGFVTGFYLHGAMAILGLSIILVQSATAFAIVKYLGAAYLFWIGVRALLSAWHGIDAKRETRPSAKRRTLRNAYLEGLLTNALNPKVSMFYLAAFPQFISSGDTTTAAAFMLVFVHSMIAAVWFGAMILVMSRLTAVAQNGRFQRWLKGVTGVFFIGFGAKLAFYRPNL
ncbi:LysE family translocator [Paralimibaculum aggregatum]|uniref:LysE family translocator n=1 Tax=Paralimibaculum aggregatum TaxID=3036245 RepID=A0ABQ6LMV8_9RHOB|nr:LysE family translocator [Limibaculum sp. NKW23]GMG84544.1 LysE family translocator [Limibaculum sp. NKW23]